MAKKSTKSKSFSAGTRLELPLGFAEKHIGLDINIIQLGIAPSNKAKCNICWKQIKFGEPIATTKKKKSFGNTGIIANVKKYLCIECLKSEMGKVEISLREINDFISKHSAQN